MCVNCVIHSMEMQNNAILTLECLIILSFIRDNYVPDQFWKVKQFALNQLCHCPILEGSR